ncbi:MAG: helix-turn-helix domain-containing protein [Prevotella intermedia]|jgi:transcriptional regulator
MNDLLHINNANDYANDIGAPVYHPHISVIHYDEVGKIRHTLNRFNVYAIFVQKNFPDELTYGIGNYATNEDALLAYAPGQIGGKSDDGTIEQYYGWVLIFDPEFVYNTEFERNLSNYHYFSYNTNEALKLTTDEMAIIDRIMSAIRRELKANQPHTDRIVQDYILLLADFCNRFYDRQFLKAIENKSDILVRFQQVLLKYYEEGKQYKNGIPSVKYCSNELFMSPSYFGDVIRKALGQAPLQYIRSFVIECAKTLIASGKTIAEVAYSMGFDYPQHFTRVFRKETGILPSQYLKSIKTIK